MSLALTALANTQANRRFTFRLLGPDGLVCQHAAGPRPPALALALTDAALAALTATDTGASRVLEAAVLVVASAAGTAGRYLALVLAPSRGAAAAHGGHHLFGSLVALLGVGADHAGMRVTIEQAQRDLVQSRLDSRDLGQDVDAIAVLVDHLQYPANLSLDPRDRLLKLLLAGAEPRMGFVSVRSESISDTPGVQAFPLDTPTR